MENRVCKLILIQIGSPKSLDVGDIRDYLKEFLSNRNVVDINPLVWKPILNNIILKRRPKKLLRRYDKIWDGREFALVKNTRELSEWLSRDLSGSRIECDYAFLFGKKTLKEVIDNDRDIQSKDVYILPLFPQYSLSTWGLVSSMLSNELQRFEDWPNIKYLPPFYNEDCYINNVSSMVKFKLSDVESDYGRVDHLVVSFHGLPLKQVKEKKDPYLTHSQRTFDRLCDSLESIIPREKIVMTFQSRFGFSKWLSPYTDKWILDNARGKHIVLVSPSFLSDSLETLVEIREELKRKVKVRGGRLHYVRCLNTNNVWLSDFSKWIKSEIRRLN